MYCRSCGHNNEGRDSGKCENCRFELSTQNLSGKEKRSAIQERSTEPAKFDEHSEFKVPIHKKQTRIIGIGIALAGVIIAVIAAITLESPYYEPPPPERESFESQVIEIPINPTAELVGSDIVYLMSLANDTTVTALSRASVDMAAIPNGSTVSFLGDADFPLKATVTYMLQKIGGRELDPLTIDRIGVWTDSTETDVVSAPFARMEVTESDSIPGPVTVKFYFTPDMLRATLDEWNLKKDIAISGSEFKDSEVEQMINWVPGRLSSRDIEGREIQVVAMFDYNVYNYGDVIELLRRIEPLVIDSLGYNGFGVNIFTVN